MATIVANHSGRPLFAMTSIVAKRGGRVNSCLITVNKTYFTFNISAALLKIQMIPTTSIFLFRNIYQYRMKHDIVLVIITIHHQNQLHLLEFNRNLICPLPISRIWVFGDVWTSYQKQWLFLKTCGDTQGRKVFFQV